MTRDPLESVLPWRGLSELDDEQDYDHDELAEYGLEAPTSQRRRIRRFDNRVPGMRTTRLSDEEI
ncbi:hypothetical protein ACU8M5_10465 [Rhizobium leguminosarum]